MKLAGKTAIVTGGSRGIGKQICLTLAAAGANVVVAARTEQEGKRLAGTIHQTAREIKQQGGRALAVRTDITVDQDVDQMVAACLNEFGRIDILVNDAAANFNATVNELTIKRWDVMMNVNLRGTFVCTKAVLPTMIEQKSGNIIAMTSIAAKRKAPPGEVCYAITKTGIELFCWGLAKEVKEHNIAVNDLYPTGGVLTDGFKEVFRKQNFGQDLLDRMSRPEEIAEAALWLAQQDADSFTGHSVTHEEVHELMQ